MKLLAHRLLSTFTSRLSRQMGLWVFIGILGIEVLVFVPSAYRRKGEQLTTIAMTAKATINALAIADAEISGFAKHLPHLQQDVGMQGGAIYRADGRLIRQYGESATFSFEQAKAGQNTLHYDSPWRYEIAYSVTLQDDTYYLLLSYDATRVAEDLVAFSGRILGLVLLISASVTALMMWIVNHRLIHPILVLQADVRRAGDSIDQAQPFQDFVSLQYQIQNELQEVIQACHQTHQKTVDEIVLRKQSEANLRQIAGQLEIALNNLQQTQAQLIHTEKMSSLGQLSAGFAHEINNPINFIRANLTHLANYTQDLLAVISQYQQEPAQPSAALQEKIQAIDLNFIQADMPRLIQSMASGAERIRNLVISFRNFTRLDEADHKAVDIHEGLESTLILLQERFAPTDLRPAIQIQREYGILPTIPCYPSQLNQAFFYLLTNAIEAIDQAVQITNLTNIESPIIQIITEEDNLNITISILDNGIGIAPEIQSKIFDPFFTTKDVGKGMGLGLTNSYQIIAELHRGVLAYHSPGKQGATFTITLPKA
ncbi:HAMP domain-containing histidine kinase (plasmid) [Phormidium sp. CLA17]|uniref:sensor histidine kinase n=1 Tax=Leptolyngbya sp. Cla-17 TaxID=2803751 RepID=UPI001491BA40|nr:ATP-binding protein [Leptolyngbya sp. Cla-17]MBM0744825.1 HAMP domain-containing histidine kinase [Leptolyngbya sp. Cla-17]